MATDKATTLRMLSGVPLDKSYEHTIYWESKTAQEYGFFSKVKKSYSNLSYQRVGKGQIRIQENVGELYSCNYMMFKNPSFGNKWFYAFVDKIEYVNDVTTDVFYTIDNLQSWWGSWKPDACWIERQTPGADIVGENLQPEPVALGNYVHKHPTRLSPGDDWRLVVVNTGKQATAGITVADPVVQSGVVQYAEVLIADPSDRNSLTAIKTRLDTLAIFNNPDAVVSMYMAPKDLIPVSYQQLDTAAKAGAVSVADVWPQDVDGNAVAPTLGSYKPRNKKLLTYPYTKLVLTNNQGSRKEYAYEFFNLNKTTGTRIGFQYTASGLVNLDCVVAPLNYKVIRGTTDYPNPNVGVNDANWEEGFPVGEFPKCSWATSDLGAKVVQGLMGVAAVAVVGGAVASEMPEGKRVQKKPGEGKRVEQKPKRGGKRAEPITDKEIGVAEGVLGDSLARTLGSIGTIPFTTDVNAVNVGANLAYAAGRFGAVVTQEFITSEYAARIDKFFDRYGYAYNMLAVPQMNNRPHWTYVKTAGARIEGDLPQDATKEIEDIFDNGITFWNSINEVGNYALDNTNPASTNEVTNNEQTE